MWTDAKDGKQLRANLEGLPGFGEMKVKALGSVLAKRYEHRKAARSSSRSTRRSATSTRTQALLDYQAAKKAHKAEWSKMKSGG